VGLLRKIISEEAPILFFSFLNFYVAFAISIAIPTSELLMGKEKVKSKLFVIFKIPVLMSLSAVFAQAYGWVALPQLSLRDLVGALVIIFWVHLYLNQRLQEVVE
jgi:hypothetical protein